MFDLIGKIFADLFGGAAKTGESMNWIKTIVQSVLLPLKVVAEVLKAIIWIVTLVIKSLIWLGGLIIGTLLLPLYSVAGVATLILGIVALITKGIVIIGKTILSAVVTPFNFLKGIIQGVWQFLMNILKGITNFFSNPIVGVLKIFGIAGDNSGNANSTVGTEKAFKTGGLVSGPGTGTSDSIAARLSNGEFVVNARNVPQNRGFLEAINRGVPAQEAIETIEPVRKTEGMPSTEEVSQLTAERKSTAERNQTISISLHFGDIILQSATGEEAAKELILSLQDPEVEAAIVRALRNQVEMLR